VRGRTLTALALLVIFAGAGLAVALMFPGHTGQSDGARIAVFTGLAVALSAPVFARARRRSRENGR
jgi:hypothetical protein